MFNLKKVTYDIDHYPEEDFIKNNDFIISYSHLDIRGYNAQQK